MSDLISRQAALDAIDKYILGKPEGDTVEVRELLKLIAKIYRMPSAQPHRIKGRWIYGEHDVAMCDGYRCDKCGFFVPWDYKYTFIDFINDYHFCPNCGSDMRGEDNESSR